MNELLARSSRVAAFRRTAIVGASGAATVLSVVAIALWKRSPAPLGVDPPVAEMTAPDPAEPRVEELVQSSEPAVYFVPNPPFASESSPSEFARRWHDYIKEALGDSVDPAVPHIWNARRQFELSLGWWNHAESMEWWDPDWARLQAQLAMVLGFGNRSEAVSLAESEVVDAECTFNEIARRWSGSGFTWMTATDFGEIDSSQKWSPAVMAAWIACLDILIELGERIERARVASDLAGAPWWIDLPLFRAESARRHRNECAAWLDDLLRRCPPAVIRLPPESSQ